MRGKAVLFLEVLFCVSSLLPCWAQAANSDSPFLMRMERQTREENVCMLVQQNGHYHLERIIIGRPRVFEGTLETSAINELEPLLTSDQITNLKQAQIETTLAGEDMDQVMVAIWRPYGWQSLNFPSGKSRKPYKAVMDPLVKWLDRSKQQQNPIVGAPTNRCMPPPSAQAGGDSNRNPANPYVMRIVVDHYEPLRLGRGASMNSTTSMNSTADFKVTRLCAIVYENGGLLYALDLASEKTSKIPISVASDVITARPEIKSVAARILQDRQTSSAFRYSK